MDEAEAALMLSRLPGLTQQQARALVDYYGSARTALEDDRPAGPLWTRMRRERTGWAEAAEWARREAACCAAHHIQILPYSSDSYPRLLKQREVADAPAALYYCGNAPLNRRRILSVVGTRRISEYGKQMCERLMEELSRLAPDILIVSGLAYGVDIHAHRAALDGRMDTVAVLAHGHDRLYPPLHKDTANRMTLQGGLLTEYPTGTVPDKGNFVRRNRIVAGMAHATLVIESAEKGGSLITASLAAGYGREVLAVPGRTTDEYSRGCNKLIRERTASLVTSAEDILRAMKWEAKAEPAQPEPTLFPQYTAEQDKVLSALEGRDDMSIDQMAVATGLSVSRLSDILFDLEDLDAVRKMRGNRYRLK